MGRRVAGLPGIWSLRVDGREEISRAPAAGRDISGPGGWKRYREPRQYLRPWALMPQRATARRAAARAAAKPAGRPPGAKGCHGPRGGLCGRPPRHGGRALGGGAGRAGAAAAGPGLEQVLLVPQGRLACRVGSAWGLGLCLVPAAPLNWCCCPAIDFAFASALRSPPCPCRCCGSCWSCCLHILCLLALFCRQRGHGLEVRKREL